MRKQAIGTLKLEPTASLLEKDGCTLKPVDAKWLQSAATLREYLDKLHLEIKADAKNWRRFAMLLTVIGDATGAAGTLSDIELRGLLSSGVQWLRLYSETLGTVLGDEYFEDCDGVPSPINIPFPLMSLFIDFMLFVVEMTDPRINLLTRNRRRYDIFHQAMFWDNYENSPVQQMSQIAWRRYKLHDKDYLQDEAALMRVMGKKKWAFVSSSRIDPHGDWLVYFEKGNPASPRVAQREDKGWALLADFCSTHKLEMMGTFTDAQVKFEHLHILPRRVHASKSAWGVRVEIPEFYRHEHIRFYANEDFKDLKALLEQPGEQKLTKSTEVFLSPDELRRVGVLIRKALLKASHTKDYANTALEHLGGSLSPERIIGATRFETVKNMPPVEKLMKIIDASVEAYTTNPRQRWLWAEFCRSMTRDGKFG